MKEAREGKPGNLLYEVSRIVTFTENLLCEVPRIVTFIEIEDSVGDSGTGRREPKVPV